MGYMTLDSGGDAGIRVTGNSLPEVFAEAALGMYSLGVDLSSVTPSEPLEVEIQSHSLDGLLVSWLNELVYHLDARGYVASKVEVTRLDTRSMSLIAVLAGQCLDADKQKLLIKAATYHGLKLHRENSHWQVEVLFDI